MSRFPPLFVAVAIVGCAPVHKPAKAPAPVRVEAGVGNAQPDVRPDDGHAPGADRSADVKSQRQCTDERVCRLVVKYSTAERWQTRAPFSISAEECADLIGTKLGALDSCEVASAAAGTAAVVIVHGECTGDYCDKALWAIVPAEHVVEIRDPKRHNVVAGLGLDVTMDHLHAVVDLGVDLSHVDDAGQGTHRGTSLYSLKDGTSKPLTSRVACMVSGRPDEVLCRDEQANVYSVNAATGAENLIVRVVAPGMDVASRTQDNPGPGEPLIFDGKLMAGMSGTIPGVCPDRFACEGEVQVPWPPPTTPVEAKPALVKWECHGSDCKRVAPSPLP